MVYDFLVDTYATERLKVLAMWSMFRGDDLPTRPHPSDRRGRSVLEHMVHQCLSEDIWFRTMLGIDVGAPPVPANETRVGFLQQYALDSTARLIVLRAKPATWWEGEVPFFEVQRSRAWVMVRRIAHTAHHRGQQAVLLRVLGRDVYSTYGPTADTGGLMKDHAPTVYPWVTEEELLAGESSGGAKRALHGRAGAVVTERPDR
jgi:uncharacterized damage-inducible protein DinB